MQNMKHKGGFLSLLAAALVPLISGVGKWDQVYYKKYQMNFIFQT